MRPRVSALPLSPLLESANSAAAAAQRASWDLLAPRETWSSPSPAPRLDGAGDAHAWALHPIQAATAKRPVTFACGSAAARSRSTSSDCSRALHPMKKSIPGRAGKEESNMPSVARIKTFPSLPADRDTSL